MYMSTTLTDLPIELFGTIMELGIRIPQRAAIAIQKVWRGALARGVPLTLNNNRELRLTVAIDNARDSVNAIPAIRWWHRNYHVHWYRMQLPPRVPLLHRLLYDLWELYWSLFSYVSGT